MKNLICIVTFLFLMPLSYSQVTVDPDALAHIRAAAKRLTLTDVNQILLSDSLRACMKQIASEAKSHDRRRKSIESAMWVTEVSPGEYDCEFWGDELRVPGGFDWDGYMPQKAIFLIHTHPKKSGGERPSQADYNFNKQLGMISLIMFYKRKVISANYPGSKRYPSVIKRNEFKNFTD